MFVLKRGFLSTLIVLFLLIFLIGMGCAKPGEMSADEAPKPPEVIELNLAHFQPTTHEVETILIQGWIKAIDEATDGVVKITSYPGDTLLTGTEIYEGIVDGAADIGHSCYGYTRGRFPVIETMLVPGITYNNAKVADLVITDVINELKPEELSDVKHLFSWSTGRGDLLTKIPVKKLEDLEGLEIGATAGQRADALNLLGAVGVVFSMPEQYEAISKKLTQGVIAPMETLKSFRIAEVTDYITLTPFLYNQLLFMVMNLDTWNSLPPDIQNTIESVSEQYYQDVVVGFYDMLLENVIQWMDEQGIEMETIILSDEELKRWTDLLEPLVDDHIEYLDNKGFPGREIVDTVLKYTEKYNKIYSLK